MIYKKIQDLFGQTQGKFTFNGNYTGNDFADFLLGYSNSYSELAVQDAGHWDSKSYAAYVQDNWHVNNRLTLNLGLRWDGIPHTYEENNRQSNFLPGLYNPADAAIILSSGNISPNSPGLGVSPNPILKGYQFYLNGIGIAGQNGVLPGLVKNDWALFGPRIGFAYDLTGMGKTVLRGGFGIMYERIQGNDVYNAGPNPPFSASVTFNNVALSNPNISLLTGTDADRAHYREQCHWSCLHRLQKPRELSVQRRRSAPTRGRHCPRCGSMSGIRIGTKTITATLICPTRQSCHV